MNIRWPRRLTPTYLSQLIRNQKNPLTALRIFNEASLKYPNYRHNGPVYATMIDILGCSGRLIEMKEVMDRMKNDCCECRDSGFVSAIKAYAKSGMLDEAVSLFRELPRFNCVNWTESFNTLLQIMLKESKLETAHRLFLKNSYGWEVKSRTQSLNLLMEALCQHDHSDVGLQVFQEMNYQFTDPNQETYRILMKGLCDEGRLNEAIHLLYSMFWRISRKGGGEDVVIYRTLLDALCDSGLVHQAVEILGKILRKGLKAPKRCQKLRDLKHLHDCVDIQFAKSLINEALIKGIVPSLDSYTVMAVDLYSEGKIDEANKVLSEMHGRGFRPSHLIYEAKVAAFCGNGRVDDAINVLETEMVEGNCVPTVRLYKTIIKALCNAGKSVLAVGYFDKMARKVSCVPDRETYTILVNGLSRDGRFVDASQILEEMLMREYWPGVDTYTALIRGLCFTGRQYEAVMWLEEMVSQGKLPDLCTWDSLVSFVCPGMVANEVLSRMLMQVMSS